MATCAIIDIAPGIGEKLLSFAWIKKKFGDSEVFTIIDKIHT